MPTAATTTANSDQNQLKSPTRLRDEPFFEIKESAGVQIFYEKNQGSAFVYFLKRGPIQY